MTSNPSVTVDFFDDRNYLSFKIYKNQKTLLANTLTEKF